MRDYILPLPKAAKSTCEEKLAASVAQLSCSGDSQCLQEKELNEAAHSAIVLPKEHGSLLCSPATPPELTTVPSRAHQGFVPQC